MMDFWDFMNRTEAGQIINEQDYDRKIGKVAGEMVKKYDIRYTPEDPVPSDDALADRVFEAAIELFLKLGIFIMDTRKVVLCTREEIISTLANAPDKVIYGTGNEEVTVPHRTVEDSRDPVVFFSAVGTPFPEEDFVKVCQSYAQEPLADTFSGPLIKQYTGACLLLRGLPLRSRPVSGM